MLESMDTKILKINDVIIERELYPRNKLTGYNLRIVEFLEAMKQGTKFPPICVAESRGKYYLVDGLHRLKASKIKGEKHISAEILHGLNKKMMYIEAVKRNASHGMPLSFFDKLHAMAELKKIGLKPTQISNILHMRVESIKKYSVGPKSKFMVTSTGKGFVLKKSLSHLGNTKTSFSDKKMNEIQNKMTGESQESLFTQVITLIENNLVDIKNPSVRRLFNKLKKVILLSESE